jgi:hypothetical protein
VISSAILKESEAEENDCLSLTRKSPRQPLPAQDSPFTSKPQAPNSSEGTYL